MLLCCHYAEFYDAVVMLSVSMQSVIMLSVIMLNDVYCRFTECRGANFAMASGSKNIFWQRL